MIWAMIFLVFNSWGAATAKTCPAESGTSFAIYEGIDEGDEKYLHLIFKIDKKTDSILAKFDDGMKYCCFHSPHEASECLHLDSHSQQCQSKSIGKIKELFQQAPWKHLHTSRYKIIDGQSETRIGEVQNYTAKCSDVVKKPDALIKNKIRAKFNNIEFAIIMGLDN
jgi:hypothetical protein